MVDTFVIRIKGKNNFNIARPDLFTPEFKERTFEDLSETERVKIPYSQKFILHSENEDNHYSKIKVEVYEHPDPYKKTVDYDMRIEANAPKILYSNNLIELPDNCCDQIVKIMTDKLARESIYFPKYKNAIERATVSAVHFGKNIILKDFSVREITDELEKLDISSCEDISKTRHKNGGETLQFFSTVREYAFYDKIKDIMKTRNKRIDKSGKTVQEKDIVEVYGLENYEFFRFEYRLKKYPALQSEINKALNRNYNDHIEFSSIFSRELQIKILIGAWKKLINKEPNQLTLISLGNDKLKIFKHVLANARQEKMNQHSQNKALISCGLAFLFKELGRRTVRDEFIKVWSSKANERLKDKVKLAMRLMAGLPMSDKINYITKKLEEFELIDQQYLMRIGDKLSTQKPWYVI